MPRGDSFDESLLHWIAEHRVDALTSIARALMHLNAQPWLSWILFLLCLVFVIYKRAWRASLAVIVAFYVGVFVASTLKAHFERLRPAFPDAVVQLPGYAMPSSHATYTMGMVFAVLVVVRWTSRRMFILAATTLGTAAFLIGLAMIYLGAHWATDVLAGWALGAVIGAGVGWLFRPRAQSA